MKAGEIVLAEVIDVRDNGLSVRAEDLDGFVDVTNLAWAPSNAQPADFARPGQQLHVKVYGLTEQRFYASLKALDARGSPYDDPALHVPGAIHRGRIRAVVSYGLVIELSNRAEGVVMVDASTHDRAVGNEVEVEILTGFEASLRVLHATASAWEHVAPQWQGVVHRSRVERVESYGVYVRLSNGTPGRIPFDAHSQGLAVGDELDVELLSYERSNLTLRLATR